MTRPRLRALGWLLPVALVLGSCGFTEPFRPSADGADRYRVSAVYDDALNLSVGAPVKVGGVVVGKVLRVEPDDYRARVVMAIDDDTALRQDTSFRLRYTTALGELYVDATPGTTGARLADGDVVEGPGVTTAPTVEDSLASASLLVNGGGLGQVETIVSELNDALGGRVGATRGLLSETDEFLRQALLSTRQIDRVLVSLRDASHTLDGRQRTINRALREIRPAARTLAENTDGLARLLRSADGLAVTADGLVRRTRDDLTVVVEELGPILDELHTADDQVVAGLDLIPRFSDRMAAAVPADFLNLYFILHTGSLLKAAGRTDATPWLGFARGSGRPGR